MKVMKRIGVGIIGASPINPGWAVLAHIPAIKSLSSYELIAVSTNRRDSADAAVKAFGVTAAFDNPLDLISHSGVDLVVVAVKVPNHYELAFAALDARKMVFCEWPLCTNLADAVRLGRRAEAVGVRTVIGLQARFSPAIRRTRDLIAGGFIGEVLATTVVGSGHAWGPNTDRNHAYLYYSKNGANTLTVPVMHALDALTFVLGDFSSVSAALAVRRTKVHVVDETKDIPVTAPDQVAICGTLRCGALASVFFRGGVSRGDNLRWEINGSEGDLILTSANGNVQVADFKLEGGRGDESTVHEIEIPPEYTAMIPGVPKGSPSNVGQMYAQFARDICEGSTVSPGFAHAVLCHKLLAAIETSSRTGVVQGLGSGEPL